MFNDRSWPPTAGAAAQALVTLGCSLADRALRDRNTDDRVTAPLILPDLHLIAGLWRIDGCSKLSGYLQRQFAVTAGRDFFTFPYGWRRDNRVAVQPLKEQADRWLWEWRQESAEAKLIPVGHPMCGLVARYFLEFLEGWRHTRRLVTRGTPYREVTECAEPSGPRDAKRLGPIPVLDCPGCCVRFPRCTPCRRFPPGFDSGNAALIRVSEAARCRTSILGRPGRHQFGQKRVAQRP